MQIKFIVGDVAAGKSEKLYNEIIERSKDFSQKIMVIVPEQATVQTQQALIRLHPEHAYMNIDVVSFTRLAHRVFEEAGIVLPKQLNEIGKTMLLKRAIIYTSKDFVFYTKNANTQGFLAEIKKTLMEFSQYNIGIDQLISIRDDEGSGTLLRKKIHDIILIKTRFEKELGDTYLVSEQILIEVAKIIKDSNLIQSSHLYFDLFSNFTPLQYQVVESLICQSQSATFTITLPENENLYSIRSKYEQFYLSKKMAQKIMNMYDREKKINSQAIKEEDCLLIASSKPISETICEAKTPKEEVSFVAAQIRKAIHQDKMRYKDIAVVCDQISTYRKFIEIEFERCDIAYFMDVANKVEYNILIQLIAQMLSVIKEKYSYTAIFTYLKNPLLYDQTIVNTMENYALAKNKKRKKAFTTPWCTEEDSEKEFETVLLGDLENKRKEYFDEFVKMEQVLLKKTKVGIKLDAIEKYLDSIDVEEKLTSYIALLEKHEKLDKKIEYQQVFEKIKELFEQFRRMLGEEMLSFAEFDALLKTGLDEIKIGITPPTLDYVVIGDSRRSRFQEKKLLYYIGCNDQIEMVSAGKNSILSDAERTIFIGKGLEFAPSEREEKFADEYYRYCIRKMPSQKAIYTYARQDEKGESLFPAEFINQIKRQRKIPVNFYKSVEDIERVHSVHAALQSIALQFEEIANVGADSNRQFLELAKCLYQMKETKTRMRQLLDGGTYRYENKGFSPDVISRAVKGINDLSVSKLEAFAECPAKYFYEYTLGANERLEFELASTDIGIIYHYAMEMFFNLLESTRIEIIDLTIEMQEELIDKALVLTKERFPDIFDQEVEFDMNLVLMEETVINSLKMILEQYKLMGFRGEQREVRATLPIQTKGNRNINLVGQIDRIDVAKKENTLFVNVVDYKSSDRKLEPTLVNEGIQLQLLLYIQFAMKLQKAKHPDLEIIPAGAYYMQIQNPIINFKNERSIDEEKLYKEKMMKHRFEGIVIDDETVENLIVDSKVRLGTLVAGTTQAKRKVVSNAEKFEKLLEHTNQKVSEFVEEIVSLEAKISPYEYDDGNACAYCSYHSLCQFDDTVEGYEKRKLQKIEGFEQLIEEKEWEMSNGDQELDK